MSCFSLKNNISYKKFYDKLKEAYDFYDKDNININEVSNYIHRDFINSEFMPKTIIHFLHSNEGTLYKINSVLNDKTIKIKIIDYKKTTHNKIKRYFRMILFLIKYLSLYASPKCTKNLSITIFMTSLKKTLNNKKILGVNEVNTGYSTCGCNNSASIVIYREEEWFKVLIHELFHNLNLDFCDKKILHFKKKLREVFKINAKFNIYEAYCETSARFINVLIYSFFNNLKMESYDKFKEKFKVTFENEVKNSLLKARLIISRISNCENYEENSNVFDYYVITAILLYNYFNYLKFIKYDFNFIKTDKNIQEFTNLIINNYNYNFYEALKCVGLTKSNSLKMTITNVF
tara:strand:+ start:89 stop:1129 length:1041 start_codon:yes stop_codon:yes gene_type:complete